MGKTASTGLPGSRVLKVRSVSQVFKVPRVEVFQVWTVRTVWTGGREPPELLGLWGHRDFKGEAYRGKSVKMGRQGRQALLGHLAQPVRPVLRARLGSGSPGRMGRTVSMDGREFVG
jgi:hypothetical protein